MPRYRPAEFRKLLEALHRHDVEFVVVGGVSAVLNGAPVITEDLDIVHHRSDDNIARLLAALREMRAVYRYHPNKPTPNETHLVTGGHQLLHTTFGKLDVLGTVDDGLGYQDLLPETLVVEVDGRPTRILGLARYIQMKEAAGRDKDLAVLPVLRATLKEKETEE